jgi:protocatechuate 3,4-dioxygenase, beta subunit
MSYGQRNGLGRRRFLRHGLRGAAGLAAFYGLTGCVSDRSSAALMPPPTPADGEPEGVSARAVLSKWGEAGVPLVVSGRVFAADGRTPVEGVTLYVYHTDARGHYSELDGNGQEPQPRIKGWVRTDREGRYEFQTTRPGGYPRRRDPAHIHVKAYGAGYAERWLPDFLFDDDPRLTEENRARYGNLGSFSPVMKLTTDADGVVRCTRDIRLEKT